MMKSGKPSVEQAASAYIPMDWRQVIAGGSTLPEWTEGTALFADISGFTPLTEALTRAMGLRRGAEELTRYLNQVYDALIAQVDLYGGSVVSFAGDAITCWFARQENESTPPPFRATACALAMQQAMQEFESLQIEGQEPIPLAVKIAAASGPARRFLVGDPSIQLISTLAGETLVRMAAGEHLAERGEVLIDEPTADVVQKLAEIIEWRQESADSPAFAVVQRLHQDIPSAPWPLESLSQLTEEQVRPWVLGPVYERLSTGLGEFLTELRPATVLFLTFLGIDYDQDQAAGKKLDAYIRWTQSVLALYRGTLLQLTIGDKGSYLYATFGAPIAHEDDTRRALAAAMELRRPPPEFDFISQVKIGINQGVMRTGAYGGTTRRTYGVLGDEVNLAARLMQHAPPAEVLVTQRTQKASGDAFVWEELEPIRVKGKSEPVHTAQLVGPRKAHTAGSGLLRYQVPLVGRQAELDLLASVLNQAKAGRGQIMRLEGATGVGKSHLATDFVSRAAREGTHTYVGACQSTSQHVAYSPWQPIFLALLELDSSSLQTPAPQTDEQDAAAQTVDQLAQALERLNPDWTVRLPLLGDLLDIPIPDNATTAALDPRLRQEALFTLAVDLLQARASQHPLLLLVEDLHWMDEASLALTLALARTIAEYPVMMLLAQRPPLKEDEPLLPELDSLSNCEYLRLGTLSSDGVAALVANRLDAMLEQISPLALVVIQVQAQGNPFFADEMVSALREASKLIHQDGKWVLSVDLVTALQESNCLQRAPDGEWELVPDAQLSAVSMGIPDSVHGTVLSRLDRLPEEHKLTLKVASVIGRLFELEVLKQAHPAPPADDALQDQFETLVRRDFIQSVQHPDAIYLFKHNVSQEVVYETLPGTQQRELHRAVGIALESHRPEGGGQQAPVERLAYHFSRGGDEVRDKTLHYLDKAAHKAQREYANETALNYYQQALALEERWEWRAGQVRALHTLGRRQEEQAALQAITDLPDAPRQTTSYLWGQYHEAVSDYAKAEAAIERALSASAQTSEQARSMAHLGLIARRQGDYEGAKGWYEQALNLFPDGATDSLEGAAALAQSLNGLGIVLRQQGDFDAARTCYERALALSREIGNQRAAGESLNSLGSVAHYQRDFARAIDYYQQAIEIRRTIGDRSGEATTLYNLAWGLKDVSEYGLAEEHLSSALAIHQAIGNKWEEVNVWNGLGSLYQELGYLAKAHECLSQGLQLSREIGDEAGEAYLLANLGLVLREQEKPESALPMLQRGLDMAREQDDTYLISTIASYLGLVHLDLGQFEQAIDQADNALNLRREMDMDLSAIDDLATLAAAQLGLGNKDKALVFAEETLAALNACSGEGPEFPQRDYFVCYQVLQALGRQAAAEGSLRAAYELVIDRADKIQDPDTRQSYLQGVSINRAIVQEAAE